MHTDTGDLELLDYGGFILDIEGVLIRGERVIDPAITAVQVLKDHGRVVLLSNISDLSRTEVAQKLVRMGFPIGIDEIITANDATIRFLKERYPEKNKCWLIGTPSFAAEMKEAGFELVNNLDCVADFVVVGLDYELNYQKICGAANAILNGGLLIATNVARFKLRSQDYMIGPGFSIKGLEYVTGKQAQIMGKPSPFMFQYGLERLDLAPDRVLTIGDKLEQDILGGKSIGTKTCLVLSGATDRAAAESCVPSWHPDFIVEDIGALL